MYVPLVQRPWRKQSGQGQIPRPGRCCYEPPWLSLNITRYRVEVKNQGEI